MTTRSGGRLLRFAAIGGLLFLAQTAWRADAGGGDVAPAPAGAVLSDEELLVRTALARGEHLADPVVRRRLVQNLRFALDDERRSDGALLAEALALRLHESDPVVRRRLLQRAELRARERARAMEPSEAELRALFRREAERWQRPARVRLAQVPLGETLPLPRELGPLSEEELARRLGAGFARATFSAPVGRWVEPVASAYGSHRLLVRDRQPGEPASFEAVRAQLRERLLAARGQEALHAEIVRLRERFRIATPPAEPAREDGA